MGTHACNPNTGEVERENPWGLLASQSSLISVHQVNERPSQGRQTVFLRMMPALLRVTVAVTKHHAQNHDAQK